MTIFQRNILARLLYGVICWVFACTSYAQVQTAEQRLKFETQLNKEVNQVENLQLSAPRQELNKSSETAKAIDLEKPADVQKTYEPVIEVKVPARKNYEPIKQIVTISGETKSAIEKLEGPSDALGEGDQLQITVFGQPDLGADVTVGESGVVTLPLVGTVEVKGRSATEIAAIYAKKLESGQYLKNPKVSARIIQQQSRNFSVLGEVARPGRYPLQSNVSVLDGIGLAGGLTAKAEKYVRILRRANSDRNAELIEYAATKFDLDGGKIPDSLAQKIKPNDIIFVPQIKNFYVYGEVKRPGSYPMEDDMNVMRALSIGGGITERGSARRVVIHRKLVDGNIKEIPAGVADAIQAGDVIYVNERIF